MTSEPIEPDRSVAPPGSIDLPLPSPGRATASSSFSPGPTDPPVGAGPGSSAAGPVDEDSGPVRLLGHRRRRVVAVGITLTALLSVLAISLLFYQWANKAEPTAPIFVWGRDGAWDGARVVVRGGSLRAPLTTTLRAEDNLIARFHVPPGDYLVRVEDAAGRVIEEARTPARDPLRVGRVWWPFKMPPRDAGLR